MTISSNPWSGGATDKAKEGEGGNFVSSFTDPAYERQGRSDLKSNLKLQGEKNPILLRGVAFCALGGW